MKNKKVIIGVIIGVFVILLGVLGYFIAKDLMQEQALKSEINELLKKDITKERFNTEIKTKKDYAKVEKAIKNYLDEYATTLQSVMKMMEDDRLTTILSADNYKNDGPDFVKTKEYLTTTKTDLTTKLNRLTEMTSEKEIMAQINDKKLNKNYVKLYKELMLEGAAEDLTKAQKDLKTATEQITTLLDVEEKVINLLSSSKGKWVVEGDKIVFQDTNTLNQYNELVKSLS